MITFLGGLAANIGIVLVVGAAIVVDRYGLFGHGPLSVGLVFFSIGFLGPTAAYYLFPNRRGAVLIQLLGAVVVFGLVCLVGFATGIAK